MARCRCCGRKCCSASSSADSTRRLPCSLEVLSSDASACGGLQTAETAACKKVSCAFASEVAAGVSTVRGAQRSFKVHVADGTGTWSAFVRVQTRLREEQGDCCGRLAPRRDCAGMVAHSQAGGCSSRSCSYACFDRSSGNLIRSSCCCCCS